MKRRQNAAGQCPQSSPLALMMCRNFDSEAKAHVWRQLPDYLGRQLPGYLGCDVHANLRVCSYYFIAVVPMYINPHMRKGACIAAY
jgi:hypothetical protein